MPRSEGGFTLIELLVVIAIIGLLSSIVLASLNSARDKGRIAAAVATQDELRKAVELYYSDMGFYPPDVNRGIDPGLARPLPYDADIGLDCAANPGDCPVCGPPQCPANWTVVVKAHWHGPYMPSWPQSTPWGGTYDYNYWPVPTARGPDSTCIVPPGLYIGVQGDYANNNTIPPQAEQQMLNARMDFDGCLDGESQLLLESL
jgi:general secretion pathway protein G